MAAATDPTGGDPQNAGPPVLLQRALLLELLDRPEGGTMRMLARRLREPAADVRAAAAALEVKSLADVQDDHARASGPALCFDDLFDGVAL